MGIEYTAVARQASDNNGIATEEKRCVRFLCEKRCHTSQRQPMRALFLVASTRPVGSAILSISSLLGSKGT
jgi:hypothetical protein